MRSSVLRSAAEMKRVLMPCSSRSRTRSTPGNSCANRLKQRFEGVERHAGHEQLEALLVQPGRRDVLQQLGHGADRRRRIGVDLEPQLHSKANRPQHAHRVFPITHFRLPDEAHHAGFQVLHATRVVDHGEVGDVVVQRVDGEIAPQRILFQRAVDVVADDHAVLDHPVSAGIAVGVVQGPEGGDLDDLRAEVDVGQAEATADQAAVSEQLLDRFRPGIGGDIEILGLAAQREIAHTASHEVCLVAGALQPIEHLERIVADIGA